MFVFRCDLPRRESIRVTLAAEARQMQEVSESQQRELGSLLQSQTEARTALEEQLREEKARWMQQMRERVR